MIVKGMLVIVLVLDEVNLNFVFDFKDNFC